MLKSCTQATLFLLCFLCVVSFAKVDIITITGENFEETVMKNDYVLVYFYSTTCSLCKEVYDEFEKVPELLKLNNPLKVKLARVNLHQHMDVGALVGLMRIPEFMLFVNGRLIIYSGGRTAPEIVEWIHTRVSAKSKKITSAEELKKLVSENELVAVYLGPDDSEAFKSYSRAQISFNDILFLHSGDLEVRLFAEALPGESAIVLYKSFDEGKNILYKFRDESAIFKFLKDNSKPKVASFNQKTFETIFGSGLTSLIVLAEGESTVEAEHELRQAALGLVQKIEMVYADVSTPLGTQLADLLAVEKSELPAARIISFDESKITKYKPSASGVSAESLLNFFTEFRTKKLQPYFRGEPVPAANKDIVKVLVTENFEEFVMDEEKYVVVLFYSERSKNSQEFLGIFEKVSRKVSVLDGIAIGKINLDLNEAKDTPFEVPLVRIYIPGQKEKPEELGDMKKYKEAEVTKFILNVVPGSDLEAQRSDL